LISSFWLLRPVKLSQNLGFFQAQVKKMKASVIIITCCYYQYLNNCRKSRGKGDRLNETKHSLRIAPFEMDSISVI